MSRTPRRQHDIPPGQHIEPSPFAIQAIEKEVLPQLQSGQPTYLVATENEPRVVTLPPWPGISAPSRPALMPVIDQSSIVPNRWQKVSLLGLVYIMRGDIDMLLGHRRVTCYSGNFVFLPPGWSDRDSTTLWRQLDHDECDMLWIFVRAQEALLHLNWRHGTQRWGSRHLFIPDNRILALTEQLQEEISNDPVTQASTQLLWLIYDRVLRKLQEGQFWANRHPLNEIPTAQGELLEAIGPRAQKYVDANLMERITLESVARAVFTSRVRLAREFQQHTGETLGVYLLRNRIERAKSLLETTSNSVKEIAWRTGFPDPDYFCVAFRRKVGCTPSEYRKKIR
jgi:AraC-like DNA-binding protein